MHDNRFKTLPYVCSETQKNSKTGLYFFVFRNKCRAEFWTDYHAFFCNGFRILTASMLSAHFFRFFPRDFKKLTWIGRRVSEKTLGIRKGHFEWIHVSFMKSLGKNQKKWADNPVALKILNRLQQTASKLVYNSGLQYFWTTKKNSKIFLNLPKIVIQIIEFVIQNQFKGCSIGILGLLWQEMFSYGLQSSFCETDFQV